MVVRVYAAVVFETVEFVVRWWQCFRLFLSARVVRDPVGVCESHPVPLLFC